MKHPKTTIAGIFQLIGWVLLGIALYADLAGLPKSYALAHCGLIGCIIIGLSAMFHAWHTPDKDKVSSKTVLVITASLFLSLTTLGQTLPPLPQPIPSRLAIMAKHPAATLTKGATLLSAKVAVPKPQTIVVFVWQPNYDGDNEATELLASTDLSIPSSQWRVKFIGRTNTWSQPATNAQEFFRAANILTTNL